MSQGILSKLSIIQYLFLVYYNCWSIFFYVIWTWTRGISSEDLHLKGPTLYQLRHLPATKHAQLQRVETTVIENEYMYL